MPFEQELFHELLDLDPSERSVFLERRLPDDAALRQRLQELLAAHERAEAHGSDVATTEGAAVFALPDEIGPYRVLEQLGEGGMGVVYAAEQSEPFRRRVAIKVVKLGMDTREVLARFEAERQALAIMDHPGIAKVLDAGVTASGRPYFVMELVKGLPLIGYCTTNRVPMRARLQLFVDVCAAIQHAHQKGLIHRDLKPSNVLVANAGGRPAPKVIDFGVAKATAAPLTERTIYTEQGRLIGTPEYMSPEQAEMSGGDIDSRADVYSLGVMLYELLTDRLPFDSKELRAGGYSEILRIIREVQPARPSTALRQRERTGDGRRTPAAQVRAVRGELDWIVMRAIEKDRTLRYRSAGELAEDVERYLADRPVLAGPPSFAYTLKKFVQRHRVATAMALIVVLSTIAGVGGLTAGLVRAREAESVANERAENAQATAGFLEKVLFQADPEVSGASLSLLDLMKNAGLLIDDELAEHPEVEASVRESLGVAFRRRSMFAEAQPHLRRSLELRRVHLGDTHLDTGRSCIAMAALELEWAGRTAAAATLFDEAQQCYRIAGLVGGVHDGWLQLDIGIAALMADRLVAAEVAFSNCREYLSRAMGARHPDISRPVRGLAEVALRRGDAAAAERLAREAVGLCEGQREDYIAARARQVLVDVLIASERYDEAEQMLADARAQFAATVGERHIRIAELAAAASRLALARGDHRAALASARRCESLRRELLHPDHWALPEALLLQQRARIGLGEARAAAEPLRQLGDVVSRQLGSDHWLAIQVALASVDAARAQQDDASVRLRERRLANLRESRAARLAEAAKRSASVGERSR